MKDKIKEVREAIKLTKNEIKEYQKFLKVAEKRLIKLLTSNK